MIPLLRAEARKLFSVRSTYVILILAFLLVGFVSFYAHGIKGTAPNPFWLLTAIREVGMIVSIFFAIIAILLVGHEYRHNTIMYTLTAANSRTKVLLAKVIVVACLAFVGTVAAWLFASGLYCLGAILSPNPGSQVVTPEFLWGDVGRTLYFVVAYSLTGLLLVFLFRHVVGAVASLFVIPTVEDILGIILKTDSQYLPFSTLEKIQPQAAQAATEPMLLFALYLVGGWIVAWYLFLRRDAN
jgi:ABC-2 type transport system permease protein